MCPAWRRFSLPQNPRWTEALSLDPKRTTARRTSGQKRQTVQEEHTERRGGKSRHLEEEANTQLCSVGMNFHHLTLFIAQLSDVLYVSLFIPGEKHCIYHQLCAVFFSSADITETDMLNVRPSNRSKIISYYSEDYFCSCGVADSRTMCLGNLLYLNR